MGVYNNKKISNFKPYRHPHYHEIFQGRQEDEYRYYRGRRWNNHQYSWNMESKNHYSTKYYHGPTSTANYKNFNNDPRNQGKENYATTRHQGLQLKGIDLGWMDHHQWKEENNITWFQHM
jgi:hypothetical protein